MKKILSHPLFEKIKKLALGHKIVSGLIIMVIIGASYYGYKKFTSTSGETRYVETAVTKGTLVTYISGSGQVSATNQIDVKAKVSGDITWVGVKAGQNVYAGQTLAAIDDRDAKSLVAEAEASLEQAKLQFQKDQVAAPIDYQKLIDAIANAKDDLATEYNDTFNAISKAYLDLPAVVTGSENILYGYDLSSNHSQTNVNILKDLINNSNVSNNADILKIKIFADSAENDYKMAREKYDATLLRYKQINRTSDPIILENLLAKSIDTATAIALAVQSELNFLSTVFDITDVYKINIPTGVISIQTNARSYLSTANENLSSLLSRKKSIEEIKQTIKTNEQNLVLLKVGNSSGDNPISLQISKNNLTKQERALSDLKTDLNNHTIVATFAGTLASVQAKAGESAGIIATIITKQQVAELSMNEVDAAKINLGQKTTLTFDAIADLTLAGTVAEIDPVGTVSQGVVTYKVKISFDTQDSKIKSGMSVSANIITGIKQDVLIVPNSAVKTSGGLSYVEIFDSPLSSVTSASGAVSSSPPQRREVVIGLSNDTSTEIISGLNEGDLVVSRTVSPTTATTQTAPSIFGGLGGNRSGGGNMRRLGQ
ncbi:MAG: HlyD family efflux transporter periplasmic adaptor subunit [Candidatus Zambryskibacteria bacterium]|nr:HlyD family efflux transporter periplasmic adaptor subunit [Candidatus Zambryskibacteria bacterium]